MKSRQKLKIDHKILIRTAFGIVIFYLLFIIVSSVKSSLLFSRPDRINIVFYGENTVLLSYGFSDGVHYMVPFPSNLQIVVPGGYGRYKIGSLGKLSHLQKNPLVLKNAFSSAISTSVDYVFYPEKSPIYDAAPDGERIPSLALLDIAGFQLDTNAHLLDRIYLFFLLGTTRRSDFSVINPENYVEKVKGGDTLFSEEDFFKKYVGYFYQKRLREEQKNVQILYTKIYSSAGIISRVLEGEGIRVVDISIAEKYKGNTCIIKEKAPYSKTSFFLSDLFSCSFKNESPEVGDIQLYLGETVQKEWE